MSPAHGSPAASDDRAWQALCAVAALGALAAWVLGPSWREVLDWQPGLVGREPWRAITAAWVHHSPLHLAANLLGTALVAALGRAAACTGWWTLAWALAWPLTQLPLRLQPALLHYGGLSGVLHAAVAVAVVRLLLGPAGPRRTIGAALAAGLLAKLLLETPWAGALRVVPGWDITIAPLAHVTGTVAGAVCALVVVRDARQAERAAADR